MIAGSKEENPIKEITDKKRDLVMEPKNENKCHRIIDNVQNWVNTSNFVVSSCAKDNVSSIFDGKEYTELLPVHEQCISTPQAYEMNEEQAQFNDLHPEFVSNSSKGSREIKVNKY